MSERVEGAGGAGVETPETDVLAVVADLRSLGVPESALRPIEDWQRHRSRLARRYACPTCKDTGWVPSGCECHDDPCPRCRPAGERS